MKRTIIGMIGMTTLALGLVACDGSSKPDAQSNGQHLTEQAYGQAAAAVPYPAAELRNSLERENLKRRLLEFNKAEKIGYVYLMSFGKFIGYYTVKGKVSSTQSQMTTDQLIERRCYSGNCEFPVVNAPGDDLSYGENEPGIFFFTTQGVMVETDSQYVYSDQPLAVHVPELHH